MKRITFILNGTIPKINKIIEKLNVQFKDGFDCEYLITDKTNHAIELSENAIMQGCDYLIAVGGDGTLNEVINGYMKTPKEKRAMVKVGLIPKGTGNDFARLLGIGKMNQLHHLISTESYSHIDIGEANYLSFDGLPTKRFYCNITDIGVGAMTVKQINTSNKFFGATLTFLFATLKAFFSYKHQQVKVSTPDFEWTGSIISVVMANGKYFGSGLGVAYEAKIDDGILNLVIVSKISVFQFLRFLPTLRKGKKVNHPNVNYFLIQSCKIEPIVESYPIDIDGEYIGNIPLEVKINSKEVLFLYPKTV